MKDFTESILAIVAILFGVWIGCISLTRFTFEKNSYEEVVISKDELDTCSYPVLRTDHQYHTEYKTKYTGFKGNGISSIDSIEELIQDDYRPFVLTIEADKLTPTGIYKETTSDGISYHNFKLLSKDNNMFRLFPHSEFYVHMKKNGGRRDFASINTYAQFYVATLKSGENLVILIDDSLCDTTKGTVTLPIGLYLTSDNSYCADGYKRIRDTLIEKYNIPEGVSDSYVDTVSGFKLSQHFKDAYRKTSMRLFVNSLIGIFLIIGIEWAVIKCVRPLLASRTKRKKTH